MVHRGSIVKRVVARRLDPERLTGLRRIGIDEFSYRKRHRYLTVVVDHDRGRVVWTGEGKSADTLAPFFDLLVPQRCQEIETVTIDLSAAFIKAVREGLPRAETVFDRFHVQRLASDAVDEWLAWASRSKLKPFVKAARTIRKHRAGILAYVKTRLRNGLVEGFNGKIRMIARRAFGLHSHQSLSAMFFLNCGGLELCPPIPTKS